MDRFADGMTARGPTLAPDRETWTGSLHIVDLPGVDAAHEFVEHEPYNRAGLFSAHTIRRFTNLLGRTMWEFPRESDDPLFFVLADELIAPPTEGLIVHGELSSGIALAFQAPTRGVAEGLFEREIELHDWEFGGRR
jgi:hypothetical protein